MTTRKISDDLLVLGDTIRFRGGIAGALATELVMSESDLSTVASAILLRLTASQVLDFKAGVPASPDDTALVVWDTRTADNGGQRLYVRQSDGSYSIVPRGGGGGGGDVTEDEFNAAVKTLTDALATLMTRSDDGDETGTTVITQPTQLLNLFVSQEVNDSSAWAYFATDVTEGHEGVTHTYKAGDLAYFAPRNIIGKVVANLEHPHDFTFASADDTDKFAAAVRGNASATKTLLILCTATYTAFTGGKEYNVQAGDIWAVYARSTVPHRFLPLQQLLAAGGYSNDRFSIRPVNGLPGIATAADLDGNYWLHDPDIARGIDISEATRWVLNIIGSDGIINSGTQVHEVDPWVPNKRIQALVNVSASEETNVQSALASTPGVVRFALSILNVNARVLLRTFDLPINEAFVEPSGSDPYVLGDDLPFLGMQLSPASIPDDNMVSSVSLLLHNQLTSKTITGIALSIAGQPGTLDTDTPISAILQQNGVVRFTFSGPQIGTIGNAITATVEKLTADVTFTYSDSTTKVVRMTFGVQDPNADSGGGGGGGGLANPTSLRMDGEDRFIFVEPSAVGVLRYAQSTMTQMIDRFRSGMAVVSSSAKGLMAAADKVKLDALPTLAALNVLLGRKQDNLPTLANEQIWWRNAAGTLQGRDVEFGDSVIRFGNPTDLGANPVEEGLILAFGSDPLKLYVPHFKELLLRDIAPSDFRTSGLRWRGAYPDRTTVNAVAGQQNNDVAFVFNHSTFGVNQWLRNTGSGWERLSSGSIPAKWSAYATLEAATAAVSDAGRVVLTADGTVGVTQRVDGDRWVLLSRPDELRVIPFGAAIEFNANKSHEQEVTLTGNTVLSMINGENGSTSVLRVRQDGTGGRTIAFRGIIGTAPTLSTSANSVDLMYFHKDGTDWVYVAASLNIRGA